jgi:serine/threonine protein kinase
MDNYVELGRIGEGAFGEVARAKNIHTNQIVAIKKIFIRNSHDGLPVTVWREIKAMQVADHPNILEHYDSFAHGSSLVIVMECMTCSLADCIQRAKAPFPEGTIKYYMQGLFGGLEYLHSLGMLHRDVKPANVLISPTGAVKLGDFGLARLAAVPPRTFSHQARTLRPPRREARRIAKNQHAAHSLHRIINTGSPAAPEVVVG